MSRSGSRVPLVLLGVHALCFLFCLAVSDDAITAIHKRVNTNVILRRQRRTHSTWPRGSYGLPRVAGSGCPSGFGWRWGQRYHDTEDSNSDNRWSRPLHMSGRWGNNNMHWNFCMQTFRRRGPSWPRGTYCIFSKYGCPNGFRRGYLYFDDEDKRNRNRHSGIMPDGEYNRNTRYYFCCRRDKSTSSGMTLPTQRPFILFQYACGECQAVRGMRVIHEWFQWDCEDRRNANKDQSPHPRHTGPTKNWRIHMCYYYR